MLITCHRPGVLWSTRRRRRERKKLRKTEQPMERASLRAFRIWEQKRKAAERGLLPGRASSFCWLFGLLSQWSCFLTAVVPWCSPPTAAYHAPACSPQQNSGIFQSDARAQLSCWGLHSGYYLNIHLYNVLQFKPQPRTYVFTFIFNENADGLKQNKQTKKSAKIKNLIDTLNQNWHNLQTFDT